MKTNYLADIIIAFVCGIVVCFLLNKAGRFREKYQLQQSTIEIQKQTIEHLNFIISRHDTTHSKCFKIK